jgi:cytochrome oxidase Cu insertion factor (SCO1/SenC/PrrC family)
MFVMSRAKSTRLTFPQLFNGIIMAAVFDFFRSCIMIKKLAFVPVLVLAASALHAFEEIDKNNLKQYFSDQSSADIRVDKRFPFEFPDMALINQNNEIVRLDEVFSSDRNSVFAFFFTHCVTVCTTITMSLKSIQNDLPPDTNIVMISIDPVTDTPYRLKSYADEHAIDDPNWQLLTGSEKDIINLQRRFEAYRGNKMNHSTSLFVSKAGSGNVMEIETNFAMIPKLVAGR